MASQTAPLDSQTIAAMVAARKEGGLKRTLHDTAIVAWRNTLIEIRNPASILVSTVFAISLLFVFTASFARVVSPAQASAATLSFYCLSSLFRAYCSTQSTLATSFTKI